MKKNKIFVVLFLIGLGSIWFIGRGDDKEQIANEIKEHWSITNIQEIELIDNNKSIALFKDSEGVEWEMYLEKSFLSWNNKMDFSFSPPEGTNEPFFISMFDSPFSNEGEYHVISLSVLDSEIANVKMVNGKNIIHNFELTSVDSREKFAFYRTKSDAIYEAEFIAYNSKGEVVSSHKN